MALPEDVLGLIATYMSYNDRVNMNQILSHENQVIKKLDSDAHNLAVKSVLVEQKLIAITRAPSTSVERLRKCKQLMLYLLHSKDDCLFRKSSRFVSTVKSKAHEFTQLESFANELIIYHLQDVKSLMRASQQVISYLDVTTFPPLDVRPKIVTIYT